MAAIWTAPDTANIVVHPWKLVYIAYISTQLLSKNFRPIPVHVFAQSIFKCEALLRLGISARRTYVRTRLLAFSLLQIFKILDSHKRLGFLSIFTYLSIFSLSQIYSVCISGSYHCTDILNVQLVNFSWKSEKIKYLCEDGATFFDQYV